MAFGGLGLLLAGVLRAEVNLAAANGLYLVLLLLGGMVVPLAKLPAGAGRVRPGAAGRRPLRRAARRPRHRRTSVPVESWVVLAVWAVAAPLAAAHLPLGVTGGVSVAASGQLPRQASSSSAG